MRMPRISSLAATSMAEGPVATETVRLCSPKELELSALVELNEGLMCVMDKGARAKSALSLLASSLACTGKDADAPLDALRKDDRRPPVQQQGHHLLYCFESCAEMRRPRMDFPYHWPLQ